MIAIAMVQIATMTVVKGTGVVQDQDLVTGNVPGIRHFSLVSFAISAVFRAWIIIEITYNLNSSVFSCSASNFASRVECFKCHEPRPEGVGSDSRSGGGGRGPRPGDWTCQKYLEILSQLLMSVSKQ